MGNVTTTNIVANYAKPLNTICVDRFLSLECKKQMAYMETRGWSFFDRVTETKAKKIVADAYAYRNIITRHLSYVAHKEIANIEITNTKDLYVIFTDGSQERIVWVETHKQYYLVPEEKIKEFLSLYILSMI